MKPSKITAAILALSIVSSAMPAFEVSAADAVTTTTGKAAVTTTATATAQTTTAAQTTTTSESTTTTTTTAAVSSTDSDTKLYAFDHKSWCEFNEKTGELILHGELNNLSLFFFQKRQRNKKYNRSR